VLERASATLVDRSFDFFEERSTAEWRALVGVDLLVPPGRYPIRIEGRAAGGAPVELTYMLTVRPRRFPERRIEVEPRFVTPPPEVRERIRREAARLAATFAARTPERLWRGTFTPPVPTAPSSSFGRRGILNGKPGSPHTGTDFSAPPGTPVHAPAAGKVVLAEELYYSGRTVILDHGLGLYSLFGHLESLAVAEGAEAGRGDLVGGVGSTGRSTGPHLHWAVRLAGARVDPLALVAALRALEHPPVRGAPARARSGRR
jgi:murein DD-endopeptidase MepM/ murein hydrolase activator NlpD